MSTILILVPQPVPADDEAAWDWLDEADEALLDDDSPPPAAFLSLISRLTEVYPDEDESGVWAEVPLDLGAASHLIALEIRAEHLATVRPFVIEQAHQAGMVVFDTDTAEIFRVGQAGSLT